MGKVSVQNIIWEAYKTYIFYLDKGVREIITVLHIEQEVGGGSNAL